MRKEERKTKEAPKVWKNTHKLTYRHDSAHLCNTVAPSSSFPWEFVWLVATPSSLGNILNVIMSEKDLPLLFIVVPVDFVNWVIDTANLVSFYGIGSSPKA